MRRLARLALLTCLGIAIASLAAGCTGELTGSPRGAGALEGGTASLDAGSNDAGSTDAGDVPAALDGAATSDGATSEEDAGESTVHDAGSSAPTLDAGSADPEDGGSPPAPRDPAELLVLTANVENLPRTSDPCPGDFRDLYAYLQVQGVRPDVFFVQQLSGQGQLDQLLAILTSALGRPYQGRVAEASPTPFASPCGTQKALQTNAVVFAADRMELAGEPVVRRSYRISGDACVLNETSRSRTIALLLRDTWTGEHVSATSLHWSTANGSGPDPACAVANARELDQIVRVHHGTASLFVAGGDTNEPDLLEHTTSSPYLGWYVEINADLGGPLGWLDPIWRHCDATGSLRRCLLDQWTFGGARTRRIDFLFARLAAGLPRSLRAHTITFEEAGEADRTLTGTDSPIGYSDHRAVWARLRY